MRRTFKEYRVIINTEAENFIGIFINKVAD